MTNSTFNFNGMSVSDEQRTNFYISVSCIGIQFILAIIVFFFKRSINKTQQQQDDTAKEFSNKVDTLTNSISPRLAKIEEDIKNVSPPISMRNCIEKNDNVPYPEPEDITYLPTSTRSDHDVVNLNELLKNNNIREIKLNNGKIYEIV